MSRWFWSSSPPRSPAGSTLAIGYPPVPVCSSERLCCKGLSCSQSSSWCSEVGTVAGRGEHAGWQMLQMERWIGSEDRDVRWVMKENLRKDRLTRVDAIWVEAALKRLES